MIVTRYAMLPEMAVAVLTGSSNSIAGLSDRYEATGIILGVPRKEWTYTDYHAIYIALASAVVAAQYPPLGNASYDNYWPADSYGRSAEARKLYEACGYGRHELIRVTVLPQILKTTAWPVSTEQAKRDIKAAANRIARRPESSSFRTDIESFLANPEKAPLLVDVLAAAERNDKFLSAIGSMLAVEGQV